MLVVSGLAIAGCDETESARSPDDSWRGSVTTEGSLTTVVNESGSIWGGEAELVEELSIGVDIGADEYMFGWIRNIYVTDERIYVSDSQVPAVRIYDLGGAFVGNLGSGPGQGPGEYESPSFLAGAADGRVFVYDDRPERITVFSSSGEVIDTWPAYKPGCCGWKIMASPEGSLWMPAQQWAYESPTGETRAGVQEYRAPDGRVGEVRWSPQREYPRVVEGWFENSGVPFSARYLFSIGPDGSMVIGTSDRYRYEVLQADGRHRIVDRHWDPVPIPVDQREWARRWGSMNIGGAMSVGAGSSADETPHLDIPHHKPAFRSFIPAVTGETWVYREGPSRRVDHECVEDPFTTDVLTARDNSCWESDRFLDIFDAEGRYLGWVRAPDGLDSYPQTDMFISGLVVYMAIEDDAGIRKVKRYRVVLPGG